MLASMLALMALVGCTKFDPWEDTGRGSHYSGGNNGGNGGNGGNNGGGTTPSGSVTLTERSDWKVVYKGRGIYTADGSNDTVENFNFTYTGTAKPWSEQRTKVPEPLMNYLLYELAFYRAGFSWGVYYPHTSDAMHFSLSELSPSLFEEGEYAMRKVFEYIDE